MQVAQERQTKKEPKTKTPPKPAKAVDKQKKSEKSIQEKYPLNPDYLSQIVVLGELLFAIFRNNKFSLSQIFLLVY